MRSTAATQLRPGLTNQLTVLSVIKLTAKAFKRTAGALLNHKAVEAWPTYGPLLSNVVCFTS